MTIIKKEGDYCEFTIGNRILTVLITLKDKFSSKRKKDFPRCISGIGSLENPTAKVDIKEISKKIKEEVQSFDEIDGLLFKEMVGDDVTDWYELFNLADELKKLKPWEFLDSSQITVVKDQIMELELYISVLGSCGEEYGLAVYIGDQGRKNIEEILSGKNLSDDFYYELQCLNVFYVNREELSKEDYELIKSHGLSFRGKKKWIQFRSYMPGLFPELPDKLEGEILSFAIQEIIKVIRKCQSGWTYPNIPLNSYYFREYKIMDGEEKLVEQVYTFEVEEMEAVYPLMIELPELDIKRILRKSSSNILEFDVMYTPNAIQEDPFERPYFPLLAFAMDCEKGLLFHQNLLSMPKNIETIQYAFVEMLKELPYRPLTVYVSKELYPYLAELSEKINVKIMQGNLKVIPDFKDYLREVFH